LEQICAVRDKLVSIRELQEELHPEVLVFQLDSIRDLLECLANTPQIDRGGIAIGSFLALDCSRLEELQEITNEDIFIRAMDLIQDFFEHM